MSALKLISLNIEGSKHLDLFVPRVVEERPDVLCLQEIFESDIERIAKALGASEHVFAHMNQREQSGRIEPSGLALFSKFPILRTETHYYHYAPDQNALYNLANTATKRDSGSHCLLLADVMKDDACFRLATTHFTWTPDGMPDDFQRVDLDALLDVLEQCREFVLCGDFNAPRGGEIFSTLAEKYKDNIPAHYKTSIDVNVHREGQTKPHELADKMVDGLFTTQAYSARDVRLQFGVSDHAAIVATIEKV